MCEIREMVISAIKAAGFRVYQRNPEDSWCHYTDGDNVGYAQWGRDTSISHGASVALSTVHKPNSKTGTGFSLGGVSELTPEILGNAFDFAPGWAKSSDRASVRKYRDWDEFTGASEWNKEYKEV